MYSILPFVELDQTGIIKVKMASQLQNKVITFNPLTQI